MADSHRRKTFITNLFTLLDFLTTGIYYLDFFFFKPRRDIVFICFLENLLLLQGRGCTQEGGGGQGEQWEKKEGVPLPREDINKYHLKFSEPRHCQDPGGGWATAGSLLPSLSRDVDHLPLWWCSRAPGMLRSVALSDAAPSPPCSWAGRGNAWKGAALGNRAQIWALWPPWCGVLEIGISILILPPLTVWIRASPSLYFSLFAHPLNRKIISTMHGCCV